MKDLLDGSTENNEQVREQPKGNVQFIWRGVEYKEKVEVFVSPTEGLSDLKRELNMAAGKYGYWIARHSDIIKEIENKEVEFELWYAIKYREVNLELTKATEGGKKSEVYFKEKSYVKKHFDELIELKHARRVTRGIVDAIAMKSENLRTVLTTVRKELELTGAN